MHNPAGHTIQMVWLRRAHKYMELCQCRTHVATQSITSYNTTALFCSSFASSLSKAVANLYISFRARVEGVAWWLAAAKITSLYCADMHQICPLPCVYIATGSSMTHKGQAPYTNVFNNRRCIATRAQIPFPRLGSYPRVLILTLAPITVKKQDTRYVLDDRLPPS